MATAHVLRSLFEVAAAHPERPLFTFVDERGHDSDQRTTSQMLAAACGLATYLREDCGLQPGDRALLIHPPSMAFVEAFAACLLAGIVPVPAYPPSPARPAANLVRLHGLAEVCGARAFLTTRKYRWAVRLAAARGLLTGSREHWPDLPWHVTDGFTWSPVEDPEPPSSAASDLAFLQFTSGSTAAPKGVRVCHGNLDHQLDFIARMIGQGPDATRTVIWLPQYHDAGLIGGILAALTGRWRQLWFMSPLTFVHRPAVWLETMARARATMTSAPNFAFDLVVRKTTPEQRAGWDLSSLEVIQSAAEAILPQTVDRFYEAFAISGLRKETFCPSYGLAEHTVGVTIGGRARVRIERETLIREGRARRDIDGDLEIVGTGRPTGDIEIRVVDPEAQRPVPERHVGEVWVRSPSVTDGYEARPEATAECYDAELEGEGGGWLRTGDLGLLIRGELFVTGRLKDLIIVRGRNLHPEDLEPAVRDAHSAIRPGGVVVFSQPGGASEEIVALVELREPASPEAGEVLTAVRRTIAAIWQLPATVAAVAPRALFKTTSGKIQRAACRRAWLDDELAVLAVDRPAPAAVRRTDSRPLRQQLTECAEDERFELLVGEIRALAACELQIDAGEVGDDDHLADLGLGSIAAVELVKALALRLECELPASLFVENPTLASAASFTLAEIELGFSGAELRVVEDVPFPGRPQPRALSPAATRVGVVGAGVSGLVAALELVRLGYRRVSVYEAAPECGGKVMSAPTGGAPLELGQALFMSSYRVTLGLARELGLDVALSDRETYWWDDELGFEDGPSLPSMARWTKSVLRAAKAEIDPTLPSPALPGRSDLSIEEFLKHHGLYPPHRRLEALWTMQGYGTFDRQTPAAYLVAYLQLLAVMGRDLVLPGGNQTLWAALAAQLEDRGVKVRRGTRVVRLEPGTGVRARLDSGAVDFDEVIVATPPHATRALLAPEDPLQPLLGRFEHLDYLATSFAASGLPAEGLAYFNGGAGPGVLLGTLAVRGRPGWYVGWQYDGPDLESSLRRGLERVGAELVELGPSRRWRYFPHVVGGIGTLREVEALQGARHLWYTGSWLAFESIEHCARHAGHLVRTSFDPAIAGLEPAELASSEPVSVPTGCRGPGSHA